MISNFEKHLNIRLLESQLKMSANNKIPLNLVDCFKPSELCIFEQQLKKTNQLDVDIINTEIQGKNTPTTPGAYIGLFGNSNDCEVKEYSKTQANIMSYAQALDMVSPVFDLLSIPNHDHLAQYLARYKEVCRVHCNYVDPKLLAALTNINFLPVVSKKDSYTADDGSKTFICLFGTDFRVSHEISQCIQNGENLVLYLDYREGQFYTVPVEVLKVLLDIEAVVTHNTETLNKAKLYEQDLSHKFHLINCEKS